VAATQRCLNRAQGREHKCGREVRAMQSNADTPTDGRRGVIGRSLDEDGVAVGDGNGGILKTGSAPVGYRASA